MSKEPVDQYSEAETARRRDAVLKRMLNTAPQPRNAVKPKPKRRKPIAAKRG
jgi:hypothetical protein